MFAAFFDKGIIVGNSRHQICWDVAFAFHCSPEVDHGMWGAAPEKETNTSRNKKTKSRNYKYTTKKQNKQHL